MKYLNFIIGLSVSALYACSDNSVDIVPTNETIITGNICKLVQTSADTPADVSSTLPEGSKALLNASGGLQIDNGIFTFTGSKWESDTPIDWSNTEEVAVTTVLFPTYNNNIYSQENLYKEGRLEDLLFVNGTFPYGKEIKLQFKHLFSLITFRVEDGLQSKIQKIELTTPVIVSTVSTKQAEILFDSNISHTTSITANASGYYDFIIPPATNMSLILTIQLGEKVITKQLSPQAFIGNTHYECHIKSTDEQPGISTAEDLITFSKLINGMAYTGKILEDFKSIEDGRTVYRLLNDIKLAEADCKRLSPIGYNYQKSFNDIFDGQGYTISQLSPRTSNGQTGLFGFLGANGCVRNLSLTNASIGNDSKGSIAFLVGSNNGTIENCHIKDSHIDALESSRIGALAGNSNGIIFNCHVESSTFTSKTKTSIGALTGALNGKILNSYSINNSIKASQNTHISGICGLAGSDKEAYIANCYVDCPPSSSSHLGLFFGYSENSQVEHCYYKDNYQLYGNGSNSNQITTETYSYNTDFIYNDSISVLSSLNEWIDTHSILYPEFEFKRWTKGNTTIPAIFIDR